MQLTTEEVQIRLDWVVSGQTTNITLTGGPLGNTGYTQLNPQDSLTLTISQDAVFVLRAFNGSQQTLRTLEVRLQHPGTVNPAILPPYNLSGQEVTNPTGNRLTWAYDAENAILGFRLYRNTGSGFAIFANEDQLDSLVRQYIDTIPAACTTYYVTAVYLNASGQRLETAASNQFSIGCP